MTRVPDSELHKMISAIPDPKARQAMGDILAGRIEKRVICLEGNVIIAEIYRDSKVRAAGGSAEHSMKSYRPRLDGYLGFMCQCGNDSRLAEAEKNVEGIQRNAIDRSTLEQVYAKLASNKPDYPESEDGQKIDGFLLERVK